MRARRSGFRLESRAGMDLLEYQGKQIFARHGLKVSSGRAVRSVADAKLFWPEEFPDIVAEEARQLWSSMALR